MTDSASQEQRDWLRLALDRVSDAVVTTDSEGRVTFLNAAAQRLVDMDRDTAYGRQLTEVLPLLDEATRQPLERSWPAGALHGVLLSGGGGARRIELTVDSLDESGAEMLVLRDASEPASSEERYRQLEEEVRRHAEELLGADRRKDQFLAMLAHELRNPLAPIRNAVELMRQVETADPTFQPARQMVERQVKHLARLVDDLLDVSRITRGSIRLRKETVNLNLVLQRAADGVRPVIESRAHELEVRLPAEPIRIEADPTRLEQVVTNLLDNAAKYTMPGGHIWLTAGQEGDQAVISVRDTGIGVPPDVLERVFEPFVQSDGSLARSEGGLGVGLTLVRSLVEMHGGQVEACSPGLGQGSDFVIRLPLRLPADPAVPAAEPPAATAARPLRVLVVEDNLDAAESLAILLRLWNHDVAVAHDGKAALETARQQQPEVVLLDIGLPGLDGYQVARRLREEIGLDQTLLVAMTGYGQPEDRRRSMEAGIHHHFVKPVEPLVLRNLLAGLAQPPGWESGTTS